VLKDMFWMKEMVTAERRIGILSRIEGNSSHQH